jgi:hypothetical protein
LLRARDDEFTIELDRKVGTGNVVRVEKLKWKRKNAA